MQVHTLKIETVTVEINNCTGSQEIGGRHTQIRHLPHRRTHHQLGPSDYSIYDGHVASWFDDFVTLVRHPNPHPHGCWRVKDTQRLCTGERQDLLNIVVSLPVMLVIEVGEENFCGSTVANANDMLWDFPKTLSSSTEQATDQENITYDLVGLALIHPSTSTAHFTTRYALEGHVNAKIYTYDGMLHGGFAVEEPDAKFETHISGRNVKLPDGFRVYAAAYCLRGGTHTQDLFFTQRTHALANIFNLHTLSQSLDRLPTFSFHDRTLIEMDPIDRSWLLYPTKAPTKEYISPHGKYSLPHKPSRGPSVTRYSIESEDETSVDWQTPPKEPLPDTVAIPSSPLFMPSSPPDSEFQLNCRCGFHGDGNKLHRSKEEGTAIQCDECKDWSHVACQRNGRASGLGEKDTFVCDLCSLATVAVAQKRLRKLERK